MNLNNLKIKNVFFDKDGDNSLISKSANKILAFFDPNDLLIHVGRLLDGEHTLLDIHETLLSVTPEITLSDVQNLIENVFIKNDLILKKSNSILLNSHDSLKYDRLIRFFSSYDGVDFKKAQEMQSDVFNSNILILGVGGTGGHTAHSLVASGVRNMTLVDFDSIELTNVTRQMLYTEKDIGLNKLDVAKMRLLEVNPSAQIQTISKKITTEQDVIDIINTQKFDFVVNTMDTPRSHIRYLLDRALYTTGIPYIYNGSASSNVIVGPAIMKEKTPSYAELIPDSEKKSTLIDLANEEVYITNVIEPLNGTVGQLSAFEVIKYITNCADLSTWRTRVKLNLDTLEVDKYEL